MERHARGSTAAHTGRQAMKLYEVPRNIWVRIVAPANTPPGGITAALAEQEYLFHRLDGAYSVCTDVDGNLVHLSANTEVEIV